MNKKHNKFEKCVLHFLNKKISVASAIWIITFATVIILMLTLRHDTYKYVDMDNNKGTAKNCYYEGSTRQLMCDVSIQVKQYYKED